MSCDRLGFSKYILSLLVILLVMGTNKLYSQAELVIPTGHSDLVYGAATTQDGRFMASYNTNQVITWDVESGKILGYHPLNIEGFITSADNSAIASGDRIYIRAEHIYVDFGGAKVQVLNKPTPGRRPEFVSIDKDETFNTELANSGFNMLRKLADDYALLRHENTENLYFYNYSTRDFTNLGAFERRFGYEYYRLSPDHEHLIIAYDIEYTNYSATKLAVVNVKTGELQWEKTGLNNKCAAFIDKDRFFYSNGPQMRLTRVNDQTTLDTSHPHRGKWINSISFNRQKAWLTTTGHDNVIRIFDLSKGTLVQEFKSLVSTEVNSSLSPDGKYLAILRSSGLVTVWNMKLGKRIYAENFINDAETGINSIAIDNEKRLYIAYSSKGWEVRSLKGAVLGSHSYTLTQNSDEGHISFLFPGHNIIAVKNTDRSDFQVYNLETGRHLFTGDHSWVYGIDISKDGEELISASSAGRDFKIWDAQTGRFLQRIKEREIQVTEPLYHFDGDRILAGSQDRRLLVLSKSAGKKVDEILAHGIEGNASESWVQSLAINKKGNQFVSGGNDNMISLRNAETLQETAKLNHQGEVKDLQFLSEKVLISTGGGRTRLWNLETEQAIADIYDFNEQDWLVVGKDGRFDGSDGGMQKLHYVNGKQTIELDAFFDTYYTPRLLARKLKGNEGEMAPVSSENTISEREYQPLPMVEITTPASDVEASAAQAEITVRATDQGGGVEDLRLYHNGKLISQDQRGLVKKEHTNAIERTYRVTLVAGQNVFKAKAYNSERVEAESPRRTILFNKEEQQAGTDLYVLAVGINKYKNPKYNLNYGRPDAKAFVESVEEYGADIFGSITTETLFDEQATKSNMEHVFEAFVSQARPQDAFIFYYAGHGVMSEGSQKQNSDFFLIPHDITQLYGSDDQLQNRGLSAAQMKTFCSRIPARKQLVLLDACQSGAAVETFAYRGAAEEKAIAQLARSVGMVVLAATGSEQFASEFRQLGHGVFTYALLKGMSGEADGSSQDGKITVKEIEAYLNDRIPELSTEYRGEVQYPNSFARGQDFPIGVVE